MKKSKNFARKIIAIVLSVLMAMSTFTGVLTVYATSKDDFHDDDLAANFMAWAETTDEQTCEALLDWVDEMLGNADIAPIHFYLNAVVAQIDLNGYLDSVDGALDLVGQVNKYVEDLKGVVGRDVKNLNITPIGTSDASGALKYTKEAKYVVSKCGKSYRAVNNAKDIVMALAQALCFNTNDDYYGKNQNHNVIGSFLKGTLHLGVANGFVDVYGLIGGIAGLNMWSGYQSNLVYNLVAQILFTKTNWFTEEEANGFREYLKDNNKGKRWNYDEQLLTKLSTEFLSKISIEMTYALEKQEDENGKITFAQTDSSKTRYKKMVAYLKKQGKEDTDENLVEASKHFGYDPNLRYDRNGEGMIYLFRYGQVGKEETFSIAPQDNFYTLLDRAFKLAWKTGLKPTLETMRVNNDMGWYEGHGGNFDNVYYYWLAENGKLNKTDWKANYTEPKFDEFAKAVYKNKEYNCATVDEFKNMVRDSLVYERKVVENPQYNWRDISKSNDYVTAQDSRESLIFGKLRYSPLADKVFGIQTGPLNLYFMQTGFENLAHFIDSYVENNTVDGVKYNNLAEALNDCLVAAVKDFFPQSNHVGMTVNGQFRSVDVPELKKTGAITDNKTLALTVSKTLVGNLCKVFEYTFNTTDENILNAFYNKTGVDDDQKVTSSNLAETNLEEALVPFLVSCIRVIKATRSIHDEDFDHAKDAEGVAYVVLREFLSFSQPEKNYGEGFVKVDPETNSYVAENDINSDGKYSLFEDALLPMARDAVGYLLSSIVPCRDANGDVWDYKKSNPITDKTTLFDLLNSVVCYYGSTDTFKEPSYGIRQTTKGMGVAALLGVVNPDGTCKVTMENNLWQNISAIANSIWPTIGVLQYGTSDKVGQADAHFLIYETLIESALDIGKLHGDAQVGGITNIIKQLLTVFTSEPIMNKGIDALVYDDVLASLVNGILGAKLNNQIYKHVIPTTLEMGNTATPFDSLVSKQYLCDYNGGDGKNATGVLGILIANIYCGFGGVASTTNATCGAGAWQGAMFAVKAVSYFVNGFLPQLGDHKFGPASISVNDPSRSDFAFNEPITDTYLTIKNESVGLNRFYKQNGKIKYDNRYFVEVKSLTIDGVTGFSADVAAGTMIAPEESLKVKLTADYPSESSTATFTLTYNIYKGTNTNQKADLVYENQIAQCTMNFSSELGWFGTLTNGTDVKYNDDNAVGDISTLRRPETIIISSTNPSQIEKVGAYTLYDGVYEVDQNNNARVSYSVGKNDAGEDVINVTNVDMVDYRADKIDKDGNVTEKGKWQCGTEVTVGNATFTTGVTEDEVNTKYKDNKEYSVATRTHIAASVVKGQEEGSEIQPIYDANGNIVSVGVNPVAVQTGCVTATSTIQGINFLRGMSAVDGEDGYKRWLKVQKGTTSVAPGTYTFTLKGYDEGSTDLDAGEPFEVVVADTGYASNLEKSYKAAKAQIDAYQPSDYKQLTTYNDIQTLFAETLNVIATAPTAENASQLITNTELVPVTTTVKDTKGDAVYKKLSVNGNVSDYVKKNYHAYGDYYYLDEDHVYPIFTNQLADDNDIANGKYAGRSVQKIGNTYYYVNDLEYVNGWDTQTYSVPYYGKTETVSQYEETVNGVKEMKNYYAKENHMYIFDSGLSATSNADWAYTYTQVQRVTKPNDKAKKIDYRNLYQLAEDKMEYAVQNTIATGINTAAMDGIVNPENGIMAKRAGMESANYDVATYERMVKVAKEAEALVTKKADGSYTTTAASAQLKEAIKEFNKYYGLIESRPFAGSKIEAEIAHLTGTTKNNITAKITENKVENTTTYTNGSVTITGDPKVKYGKLVGGALTNDGYTEKSWTDYINMLARAVKVAQNEAPATIVDVYVAKKELVMAENALEKAVAATTFTVSGKVTEAIDGKGSAGTYGITGVTIMYNGKTATTKAGGSFSINLPIGQATEVTFKGANGFERKVTFSAAATDVNVGYVAIDYNGDGKINSTDIALASVKGEIGDGKKITAGQFKSIMKSGVNYAALA